MSLARRGMKPLLLALAILVAIPAASPASTTTTLRNSMLRGLSSARPLGPLAPSSSLTVGVTLALPRAAAQQRFIASLYNPASPTYHHFLTPAQWQKRFGASAARANALVGWLRSGGLRVTRVPGVREYALASGSAAQVERLFGTRIERFGFQGRTYFADTVAPRVPARLGVLGVSGLNDFEGPRLPKRPAAQKPLVPQIGHALSPSTDTGLTKPSDLWSIYDQPAGNKGDGQSMAIFGWGTTNNTVGDLRLFEHENQLPAVPVDIRYFGPAGEKVTDSGGEEEWNIDTQASTGMAPNAAGETLYFAKGGSDADLIAAYAAWAADGSGPLQGSSSFGGCEQAPGTDQIGGGPGSPTGVVIAGNANQQQYEEQLARLVAEGRTMFASTGDTGAGCPAVSLVLNGATLVPTPMLNYPAVSPNAVAVGGTVLYHDDATSTTPANRAFEYGWPYGGGGSSLFIAAPKYQTDNVTLLGHCVSDSKGNPYGGPTTCRGIPDVSAQSGDILTNGYAITVGGQPDQSGGGTSLSSPLWLGMWTRIQAAQKNAAGNGFANPALYKLGSKPGMFFDVGNPSPESAPTCNGEYCSGPGWDYVTGWGTPDVTNLMKAIDGGTAPANPSTPNAVPTIDEGNPNPCPGPQMPDKAGDAPNAYPGGDGSNMDELDILSAKFDTTTASGAPALGITMTLKNLDGMLPPNMLSAIWSVHWSTAAGTWEAQATQDGRGPAAQYSFFLIDPAGNYTTEAGTATQGENGTLRWVIPLSDLGAGAATATLTETFADSDGSFTVQGSGLHYTATGDRAPDAGFGSQWPVGTDCSKAPAAPARNPSVGGGGSAASAGGTSPASSSQPQGSVLGTTQSGSGAPKDVAAHEKATRRHHHRKHRRHHRQRKHRA